jgi:transposase
MITMKQLGKIRRLYYRDGLTISQIERRTGLTRKTVRRWLKAAEGTEPKYRRVPGETKIGPFAERLTKMLETDARRPRRDRRTALKLFAELKAAGFDGDYSRVTEFIRRWREGGGTALAKAYVPLQFEPGEAHQFDWSEEHLVIGGVWRKMMAAHLKLCFSRAFVVQAYPRKATKCCSMPTRSLCRAGRHSAARHLRQHEDGGRQGQEGQGAHRQHALCRDGLALPVRPDFCNVAFRLGERRRREERPG